MKRITTLIIFIYALAVNAQVARLSFSGNTNDSSGNGNHATNYGATLTTDRFNKPNSAYYFDGAGDYMTIGSPFDLQYRTFKIWIYLDTFRDVNQFVLVSDNPSLQYGLSNIAVLNSSGNKIRISAGNSNAPDNSINTGQWHMITLAIDNDSFFSYIDSTLVGARSNNLVKSVDGLTKTVLGASRGAANSYWTGKLDDLTIWDQYMTPAQVRALYIQESQNMTSISSVTRPDQRIYPNPFNQSITVPLDDVSVVKVFTMNGQLLYSNEAASGVLTIQTDMFVTGTYILQVTGEKSSYSQVIIKQ